MNSEWTNINKVKNRRIKEMKERAKKENKKNRIEELTQ